MNKIQKTKTKHTVAQYLIYFWTDLQTQNTKFFYYGTSIDNLIPTVPVKIWYRKKRYSRIRKF